LENVVEGVCRYSAFGLLWSSNALLIPELPTAAPPTGAELEGEIAITSEDPLTWPELPPGPHDTAFLQMARGDLRLSVEGIGRFRITDGERIGWERADAGVSDQDIRTFLLGSAVGALLIQRGMLVLHGNALEKDGQAIVCLGHSGAGKSTLAYALMQQGWRLLADDLVAVTPEGMVLPGIPRIKLWHDAAKAFGLDPAALPPIREGMNKYLLMGEALQRAPQAAGPQAAALQAVYLIHQQRHGEPEEKGATIGRIQRQQAATLRLRNQAFRPRFVRGLGQEGANFMALARLQQRVPLAALPLPAGIGAMQRWLADQDLLTAAAQAETGEEEPALEPAAP
jgi:hypothetical protein